MDFSGWDGAAPSWGVLALVNAGLAQSKRRSRWAWFLISLLLGPIATFLIVVWPYGTHLASGTPADIAEGASLTHDDALDGAVSGRITGTPRGDAYFVLTLLLLIVTVTFVITAVALSSWLAWLLAALAFAGLVVLGVLVVLPRVRASRDST
ncbi:hypothetical protein ACPEEZ_09615 [Frigoribacterium sp. 2-23]|uniref:hypothetical protein n=1 Tax=Frigoribacterium sp. 2-23 TaxID=3415006 RepID=UPI003C701860